MKHGAAARRCWIHAAAFLRGDYFCVSPNFPFNPFQWGIREWKERDRGMIVHFFAWKAVDFMPVDHVNLMIRGFSVVP